MLKLCTLLSNEPIKSVILTMVNKRRFLMGPRKALSMDNDLDPTENVDVFCAIPVRL